VEPSGQLLAAVGNPDRLDAMVGQLGVARETIALALIEEEVARVVLVDRPLRGSPLDGGHEVVVAGRRQGALLFGALALASRRRAVHSNDGEASAYFFTRLRMMAKSPPASTPQATIQ